MNITIKDMLSHYKNIKVNETDKLREILQQAALLGLYRTRFFDHAAFYGGTALRILHGLNRFSEDLDFSLLKSNPTFDFNPFLEGLEREMEGMGFHVAVAEKQKNQSTGILSAFLKMNTLDLLLTIQDKDHIAGVHSDQKLKIKLEIDVDPPLGFRTISMLVREPTPFHVLSYHLSDLFAGKMHATLYRAWKNRIKGRDWFDLIWFIQKDIPLSLSHLNQRLKHLNQKEFHDQADLFHFLTKKINSIDWDLAKKDVYGFIADPRIIEAWSPKFFLDIIQYLKIEK